MSEPPLPFSTLQARQAERKQKFDLYDQREKAMLTTIWCDKNTQVRITAWNNRSASVTVGIAIRILRLNGSVDNIRRFVEVTADRVSTLSDEEFGTGYILSIFVVPITADVRHGEVYVNTRILDTKDNFAMASNISGYITAHHPRFYPFDTMDDSVIPDGALTSVTGTNPAAGAEISETVPTNARWKIRALRVSLVADANVANRTVEIVIDDGANEILRLQDRTAITAGQTISEQASAFSVLPADIATVHYFALPQDMKLEQGWRIRTETTNLQVGDNYSAPTLIVEEWLEE